MSAVTPEVSERGPYTDYSIDRKSEVLALLDANNGNVLRTSNETGITHTTIQYWERNRERFDEVRQRKQADLAQIAEDNARMLGQSIASHDMSETPLGQKATAFGIMIDKMQLLRSQPTSITQHVNSDNLTIVLQSVLNEITSTESTD